MGFCIGALRAQGVDWMAFKEMHIYVSEERRRFLEGCMNRR